MVLFYMLIGLCMMYLMLLVLLVMDLILMCLSNRSFVGTRRASRFYASIL